MRFANGARMPGTAADHRKPAIKSANVTIAAIRAALIDLIPTFWQDFLANIRHVLLIPFEPDSRIYVLYLLTSALFTHFVYRKLRRARSDDARTSLGFLFPKRVRSHPSAWLDERYFFSHQMTGHFIATSGGMAATVTVLMLLTGFKRVAKVMPPYRTSANTRSTTWSTAWRSAEPTASPLPSPPTPSATTCATALLGFAGPHEAATPSARSA